MNISICLPVYVPEATKAQQFIMMLLAFSGTGHGYIAQLLHHSPIRDVTESGLGQTPPTGVAVVATQLMQYC